MTSMAREGRGDVGITQAAVSIAQSFAAVFGNRSIARLTPHELWRFVDRQAGAWI